MLVVPKANLPSAGDADDVLRELVPHTADRFRFWLLSCASPQGEDVWQSIIMQRCLADPEDLDNLVAVAEILP